MALLGLGEFSSATSGALTVALRAAASEPRGHGVCCCRPARASASTDGLADSSGTAACLGVATLLLNARSRRSNCLFASTSGAPGGCSGGALAMRPVLVAQLDTLGRRHSGHPMSVDRDVDASEDPDDEARQADSRQPAAAVRAGVLADEAVACECDVIDGDPKRSQTGASTGARISELCGLTWADVRIDDLDEAELEFGWQVDRHGDRRPTKTDGSARTVPIPRELAVVLGRHKLAARYYASADFVFAARTSRPLQQRNVARALRDAQERAVDEVGRPTFPVLHEVDTDGRPVRVPRGVLPSMRSFRHTVASRALLAGESVDEVAFLLGHRDGTVTRTVYVREVADARRRALRRSRMAAEYAGALPWRSTASTAQIEPVRRRLGRRR